MYVCKIQYLACVWLDGMEKWLILSFVVTKCSIEGVDVDT